MANTKNQSTTTSSTFGLSEAQNAVRNQDAAAKLFASNWAKHRGDEKQEAQQFWTSMLTDVFGIKHAYEYIHFEEKVGRKFIDAFIDIPGAGVYIEHKSSDVDLDAKQKQSDGSMLTPYEQAKNYSFRSRYSKRARWIIVCNFREFRIHDEESEKPEEEYQGFKLEDFPHKYHLLQKLLVDGYKDKLIEEKELSYAAGELVGKLYDALKKQYREPDSPETLKHLSKLCVRLVFCCYAEDAGLFDYNSFGDFLKGESPENARTRLVDLFYSLNKKDDEKDPYAYNGKLASFPYVNGGLFEDTREELSRQIPPFDDEIVRLITEEASAGLNWSNISPTIFGALFESTINPETRKEGGMHYTSIENIHKVIDPLFLDDIKDEYKKILQLTNRTTREDRLVKLQKKLSELVFFDPACGSGNFLTETYLCLRKIENQIIRELSKGQGKLKLQDSEVRVSINQFYGIEINDFAVAVAKTALWIAESQMLSETKEIEYDNIITKEYLPLETNSSIIEGNALQADWSKILPQIAHDSPRTICYIIGNPPFNGAMRMTTSQRNDLTSLMGKIPGVGEMDYVCGWFKKCADYIQNSKIKCALVSTNSVTQGQHALTIWPHLFDLGVHINFAYKTFRWDNEAEKKAVVHCVIIGFSLEKSRECYLFDGTQKSKVEYINQYLRSEIPLSISSRSAPLCDVPPMRFGSMPRAKAFQLKKEEKEKLLRAEPLAEKWVRPFWRCAELLKGTENWCLWMVGAEPGDIEKCPMVKKRIAMIREERLRSKASATRKLAEKPTLFAQIAQPTSGTYLIIPRHTSSSRKYIPMGFVDSYIIADSALQIIPNATVYHFAILTSIVHMAWMRAVGGRLKSDIRYSKDIVYNTFPWPDVSPAEWEHIRNLGQRILDIRACYTRSSLKSLYTEMPPDLLDAHKKLDKAVMKLYGLPDSSTESMIVAELYRRYKALVKKKSSPKKRRQS